MSTLFTINKSWHDQTWVFEQLAFATEGDVILLLEDAVLSIGSPVILASFIAKCEMLNVGVYALADDARMRGIENQLSGVSMIDYNDFVNLVARYEKQVAW